ncbi:MAG: amino acid ABC transporter substrate-binding protein [Deltaproteobacteria bacterium]|nr:amino acid ABC transporter substrate-binding protein [Deltaproteobacteria bacterium]
MKERTLSVSVSVIILTLALIIGAVCLPAPAAQAKDNITIGFSMALTGKYSPNAAGQMEAYQLWEELVNKKGGLYIKKYGKKLPVKLVYYDDKSSADTAVRIYEKLLSVDKVDLVLSPCTTVIHFAIAPLAAKYKVPIVGSTAASMKLRKIKNPYFWFVSNAMPDRQMRALVDLLKHLKIKDVAVIYAQELFPREQLEYLEPYLKEGGFNVLLNKDYPVGEKDLTTLLTEIKGKKPEAVIALCYPGGSFTVTAQAQEVGLNPKFLFELIGPAVPVFGPKFGKATEGITMMGEWSIHVTWQGAKEYLEGYRAKFNKNPDVCNSIDGYESCQVLEQAIEKTASLDREKIRDYIANNEFSTIVGPVSFTGSENRKTSSKILQWQNGEIDIVWPLHDATAKILYPKPPWPKK